MYLLINTVGGCDSKAIIKLIRQSLYNEIKH